MSFGLAGVTVELGGRLALDDVDLRIEPGDVTAVVGADGAGKTTTARTLVGLITPSSGSVRRPERRRVGYQPEASGTWGDLTVRENLSFVSVAHRLEDGPERIEMLLEVTGLTEASGRLAGNLSGGMRHKLAVAMAMLPRPRLAVLDEPTTGLDPLSRAELWRLLTRATAEGTAVLVTTAYLDEAERASHVVVLDGGSVLTAGTAEEIRDSLPGSLAISDTRPTAERSWRRGRGWRVWSVDGSTPTGMTPVTPDLGDVVTAAALVKREATL